MRRGLALLALLAGLAAAPPARAQVAGNTTGLGGPGTAELPALAEGATIDAIEIEWRGPTAELGPLEAAVRRAFGLSPGLAFDPIIAESALGQEWQLVLRMPLDQRLYFLAVAGLAQPGEAIRSAGGGASNWTTLQTQLFWSF